MGAGAAATPRTLVERLFRAYFLEGRFIGDRDVLAAIAGEAGFAAEAARAYLDVRAKAPTPIAAMDRRVREIGVTGVPFFIFDGQVAVSGAQEAAVLVEAMTEAMRGTADEARDRTSSARSERLRPSGTDRRIAEVMSPTML